MRVLHLSWEYPPVVYGGLGRHVHALAEAQVGQGHQVTVVTQGTPGTPADQAVEGVRVVRVLPDTPFVPFDEHNLLPWVMSLDHALARRGTDVVANDRPDVVHGHDWLVAHAAAAVRDAAAVPLVATMHATEAGRHQGWLPTPLSRAIHSVEWWFTHGARRIITCSEHMRWEVTRLFGIPAEVVDVIPNGIDLAGWRRDEHSAGQARERFAPDGGPLLVFFGRLEWEKGVHTLVDAVPRLRRRLPGLRLVIAGTGTRADAVADQIRQLRLGRTVTMAGRLPEDGLHGLVAAADAVVLPSIYEPFGLVALEAAAMGTPLVVARTGGLAEFVRDGETGATFAPGDPAALADAVVRTLADPAEARARATRARQLLSEDHGWARIADRTVRTYQRAVEQDAEGQPPAARHEAPQPYALDGNLLRDPA